MNNYFSISEFEYSETAKKLKIDNKIPEELKPGLQELIDNILNPLREAWGSALKITSGYRCPALNKAVKGSNTSSHLYALAADVQPVGRDIKDFKPFVRQFLECRKFDQCIDETSGNSEWVHLSYKNKTGQQRHEFLTYKNGKYSKWK